ncbi:hypothetical protein HYC85_021196 [Camellia sinensis]|uniref:Sieve element occlusion C-terminal domain-containing protein n=1 Tax=Camellia sinensis TaxID=4442 RepID=A0A7J7GGY5_CAMSI|nr:hypothetical protein HYC85_021196 [Camellia sinensis]
MAFPFTSLKEKELWKETRWTMELLADSIDLSILDWIVDDKYICLYGGDDLEWIRRFTKTSQAVAATAHIQLEILYVGKRKARGTVQKISNTILLEKLSHVLSDPTLMASDEQGGNIGGETPAGSGRPIDLDVENQHKDETDSDSDD